MNIEDTRGILYRLSSIRSTTAQKLLRITIKASTTPTHAPPPSLRTAGVGQFNAIRFVNCSACLPQPFPTPSVAIIQGATLNLSTRAAYQRGTSCPRLTLVAWPRYSLINLICLNDIHDCHRPRSRISSLLSPPTYARSTVPPLLSPLHPSIFPPPSLPFIPSSNAEIRIRQSVAESIYADCETIRNENFLELCCISIELLLLFDDV